MENQSKAPGDNSDSPKEGQPPEPVSTETGQPTEFELPPGLDPTLLLAEIEKSLQSLNEFSGHADNVKSAENAGRNPNNTDDVRHTHQNVIYEDKHAEHLANINTQLAATATELETTQVEHGELDKSPSNAQAQLTCFTVASPSPAEVEWIIQYARRNKIREVTQEFVTQMLTALRSTAKAEKSRLPKPADTTFKQGVEQVVVETDHSNDSPEVVEHRLRLQGAKGRAAAPQEATLEEVEQIGDEPGDATNSVS
jgi:hypothetical protein